MHRFRASHSDWQRLLLLILIGVSSGGWSSAMAQVGSGVSQYVVVSNCRVSASQQAVLGMERPGLVTAVHVRPGDFVQSGQILLQIRDDVIRAQLVTLEKEANNRIDVLFAEKLGELADMEYRKALEINAEFRGTKSEVELANLRLAAERARLQGEQAIFRLELASLKKKELLAELAGYSIAAPFSGHVLRVDKSLGETVSAGEAVIEIADFSRMRIDGAIPVHEAWNVRIQDPVLFRADQTSSAGTVPAEPRVVPGRVTFVDPRIQEIAQVVRFTAEVSNPQGLLREGQLGSVQIQWGQAAGQPSPAPEVVPAAGTSPGLRR